MTASVRVECRGRLGRIELHRPDALNALNAAMVRRIADQLAAWRHDDAVGTVLLAGAGDRAFCAGGDIVSIYHDARRGGTASVDFWRAEYALDAAIARYPKPVVALLHGLVLGGGVGLGAHARHRVVTESTSIGMPETAIGFVPDVGGTWLLSRAPGQTGTHLALTAGSVGPGDAIALGLADAFVPAVQWPALQAALADEAAEVVVARFASTPPATELDRGWIDAAYAGDDLPAMLRRLDAGPQPARDAADAIRRRSPTALTVTLAALRRAAALPSLEAALDQEFRVAVRTLGWPDLAEGIRARVIEKDRAPRWSPGTLDAVDPAVVEAAFAPLPVELGLVESAAAPPPHAGAAPAAAAAAPTPDAAAAPPSPAASPPHPAVAAPPLATPHRTEPS